MWSIRGDSSSLIRASVPIDTLHSVLERRKVKKHKAKLDLKLYMANMSKNSRPFVFCMCGKKLHIVSPRRPGVWSMYWRHSRA